jgi:hypothetical protein
LAPRVRYVIKLPGKAGKKNGERSYERCPSYHQILVSGAFGGHVIADDVTLDVGDFPDKEPNLGALFGPDLDLVDQGNWYIEGLGFGRFARVGSRGLKGEEVSGMFFCARSGGSLDDDETAVDHWADGVELAEEFGSFFEQFFDALGFAFHGRLLSYTVK